MTYNPLNMHFNLGLGLKGYFTQKLILSNHLLILKPSLVYMTYFF